MRNLALLLCLLSSANAFAEVKTSHPGANLIFISLDAVQRAHVHCLGYERETTPGLDALAKRSFVFRNNTSVASWTVPASMTWFTGVYPSEHRMTNKFAVYNATEKKPASLKELAPELITLAEILKENGYATGGFTGNAGVSGGFGYEQGFDEYYYERGKFGGLEESVPRAAAWLKQHRDEKFFLFLHGYDAHGQFMPSQGYDYRFVAKDYDQKYRGTPQEQEILREEGLERGKVVLREADVRFWRAIYDEKIQRADAWVKQFLDEVAALGLSEKTVIVVTSDHGTEVYEHQRFDHGFTLYQELLHVPLFVALPKQMDSKKIDDRVSSIDLMPTLLDLLGIEPAEKVKKQLRGQSLAPALRGERVARDVFSETDYRQFTYQRSIIDAEGYKLIYTLESRMRALFDLNKDPGERKNLASADPQRADELERRLFEKYRAIGHDLKSQRWETGLNPVYDSQAKPPR